MHADLPLRIEQMGVICIGYGGDWFYLLEGMTKYIVSGPMTSFSSHRRAASILPIVE